MNKVRKNTLVGIGILLLIIMALLYKGGNPSAPTGMQPLWWGILGIIGWSYLVCAFVYFLSKGKLNVLLMVLLVFTIINIASHTGILTGQLWLIGDGSSVSLTMGGIVISEVYANLVARGTTRRLRIILTITGILLIAVGLLIRPFTQGISKIHSTPAWVFICTGITILVFELTIYIIDIKGKFQLFKVIRPAGTSTLTCYLLPYFQFSILQLFNITYPSFLNNGAIGLLRSIATAFIIIWVGGLLEKRRLRLKV